MNKLIELKNQSLPYLSTGSLLPSSDVDSFPYTRFYRGDYKSSRPVVFNREPGWSPRLDKNYIPVRVDEEKIVFPNHCFQGPVTTIYPCMAEYQRKYSDKKEMEMQLFRTRTNEYR